MKRTLFTVLLSLLIISACRRSSTASGDILGSWKLIEVYDKNTATTSYPPAGSTTDVVLTFLNGNSFAGHTLRNTLTGGAFTQNGDKIIFGSFAMTKIAEDQWGESFLTVLYACLLQSTVPCAPSVVAMQGNIMKITTPLRYDITLEKF